MLKAPLADDIISEIQNIFVKFHKNNIFRLGRIERVAFRDFPRRTVYSKKNKLKSFTSWVEISFDSARCRCIRILYQMYPTINIPYMSGYRIVTSDSDLCKEDFFTIEKWHSFYDYPMREYYSPFIGYKCEHLKWYSHGWLKYPDIRSNIESMLIGPNYISERSILWSISPRLFKIMISGKDEQTCIRNVLYCNLLYFDGKYDTMLFVREFFDMSKDPSVDSRIKKYNIFDPNYIWDRILRQTLLLNRIKKMRVLKI